MTAETNLIGDAVKLLRTAAALSMSDLAKICPVSKPYVGRIENGLNNPTREVVQALDSALGAGGLLLALLCEGDPMRRRSLLAAIAAVAAGAGEFSRLVDGIAQAPPGRVGFSDLEAVGQAVEFATRLDLRNGGGAAAGPGRSVLGWAVRLLDASMTDDVRRRLSSQVAALADRVAWSHYDAGQDKDARDIYGVALRVAREGADSNLTAHILLDASTREAHNHRYDAAATLLRNSVLDQRELLPSVRANVAMTYARHVACMGKTREALDQTERAFDAAAEFEPDDVPVWSKGFLSNPAHLDSVAARPYLFAGEYDRAIAGFEAAVFRLGEGRDRGRAYALSLLGLAYLRGGYADQATATARLLLDVPEGLKSMRVAGHARSLSFELARIGQCDEAASVKAVAERINPAA